MLYLGEWLGSRGGTDGVAYGDESRAGFLAADASARGDERAASVPLLNEAYLSC